MGRIDTNETQYHHGLQFQEFHQTPPETLDDAPPLEEDLYEPPSDYQPQSAGLTNNPPPAPAPQPFPPPQDHHHAPPHQYHDKPPPPQPFPPPYDSLPPPHDKPPQPFPPPQGQTPQPFPPNVGMQFPPHQNLHHQPAVVGGIPVGVSPSPLIPLHNQLPTQPWKTHLFDCMKNPQNAIITLFFPCVTFGQIAEILDSGSTSCGTSGMLYSLIACCIAMPCIMSCTYRSKLRSKYGLIESPAPDWVVHCFCECCALCQEYRELHERGFDPSIGWLGNVAQQQQKQQLFGMTPPMQQRMM